MMEETRKTLQRLESLTRRRNQALTRIMESTVALAAGALTLTVSFRGTLAAGAGHLWLLRASWCLFVLTVMLGAIGRYGEIATFNRQIEEILNVELHAVAPPAAIGACANLAPWALILATAALGAFGAFNL